MSFNPQAQDHLHHARPTPRQLVSDQSFCESNEENTQEEFLDQRRIVGELSYMIHGDKLEDRGPRTSSIAIFNHGEALNDFHFLKEACQHLHEQSDKPILVGPLVNRKALNSMPGMSLTSGARDSGYHSGIVQSVNRSILEINYALRQKGDPLHILIVHFKYNIQNGRASYLLACQEDEFRSYVSLLDDDLIDAKAGLHPFAIHLVILYQHCVKRGAVIEELLQSLFRVESEYFSSDDWNITAQNANETRSRLKELHSLFRNLVIQENNCKCVLAVFQRLSKDLDRITALVQSGKGFYNIEQQNHSRIVDSFLYLQGIYQDRATRLSTRKERVNNSIAYTYNLLANRDSLASQRIAEQSTLIAHEARQDSAAMRTIAVLTMFFLPATFVSSLLGTNLFALNTSTPEKPTLVVSELWWIYLVSAIPLTLLTLLCWVLYLKWRTRKKRRTSFP